MCIQWDGQSLEARVPGSEVYLSACGSRASKGPLFHTATPSLWRAFSRPCPNLHGQKDAKRLWANKEQLGGGYWSQQKDTGLWARRGPGAAGANKGQCSTWHLEAEKPALSSWALAGAAHHARSLGLSRCSRPHSSQPVAALTGMMHGCHFPLWTFDSH